MKREVVGSLLVVLGLGLVGPAVAAQRTVTVDSFNFEDATPGDGRIVVDKGDTISFQFQGDNEHSATVDGLFDSGVKAGGQTFTTGTLMRAGTFTLYCTEHGPQTHGSTLVVRAPGGQPPAASPRPSSAKPTPTRTVATPRTSSPAAAAAAPKPPASVKAAPPPAPRTSAPVRSTSPAAAKPATSTASPLAEAQSQDGSEERNDGSSLNWILLAAGLALIGGGAYALSRRNRPV